MGRSPPLSLATAALVALATTVLAVACSSGGASPGSSGPPETAPGTGAIGQVGARLTLPGGARINTLSYSLYNGTAPGVPAGSYTYSGSEAVYTASAGSFVIAGVAAAPGYTLMLGATTDDGLNSCTNAPNGMPANTGIQVTDRATTMVSVDMVCTSMSGGDAGSILALGMFSICPVWNTISLNPTNPADGGVSSDGGTVVAENAGGAGPVVNLGALFTGQSGVLVATASSPNSAGMTFTWSAMPTGGLTFGSTTVSSSSTPTDTVTDTLVTCPAGLTSTTTYTIQLVVGETGQPAADCPATMTTGTVQLTCLPPPPCNDNPLAPAGSTNNTVACQTNSGVTISGTPAGTVNGYPWIVDTATPSGDAAGDICCVLACGGGTATGETLPTGGTYPAGTTCPSASSLMSGCCWARQPCTTDPCQPNSIPCSGSTDGVCTPTEAVIVTYDIKYGQASLVDGDFGCYACLENNGCVDDNLGDTGHECEDLAGTFTDGATPAVTSNAETACLNTLSCVLGSTASTPGDTLAQFQVGGRPSPSEGCQSTTDGLTYCFCGPAGGSASTCTGTSTPNGACAATMALGFSHEMSNTAGIIDLDFSNTSEPSGMADQILLCGAHSCSVCFRY